MFARSLLVAGLAFALGWSVSAQQPPEPKTGSQPVPKATPKAEAKELPTFEIRLSDDTQMKALWLDATLPVNTRYGKLNIPASEVRRLEFGFRYPEGVEEKINKAIEELGSTEFRDREEAEQALAGIGHYSIPGLRRALRSENPEVVKRAGTVLRNLEAKLGAEKSELRDYDTIETAEFTAKGRIEFGVLKVRTKFFGDATLRLTDIRGFRAVGMVNNSEFALDAALYAKMTQNQWLETSIDVSNGQQLDVAVSGQIDQWPQGPGQYMVGPGGQGNHPGVPRGGVQFSPGAVIGRIGPNGTPFVVGASFKGKTTESGKLYLRVSPSPWNCDSSGSYKVKVTVE